MLSEPPVLRPAVPAFQSAQKTEAANQNSDPEQQQILEHPTYTTHWHLQPPRNGVNVDPLGIRKVNAAAHPAGGMRFLEGGRCLAKRASAEPRYRRVRDVVGARYLDQGFLARSKPLAGFPFARLLPSSVRARISSRSNSAMPANMVMSRRPCAVVVSAPAVVTSRPQQITDPTECWLTGPQPRPGGVPDRLKPQPAEDRSQWPRNDLV